MMRLKLRAALLGLAAAAMAGEAGATSLSGSYLAAQAAAARNDYDAAARNFASALSRDPGNAALRDRAMTFKLLTGDLRGAAAIAELVRQTEPGHQLAGLALAANDMATGDFEQATALLTDESVNVNPLVGALLRGWAAVGRGDAPAVEAAFAELDGQPAGEVFGAYHLGLARAAMGDYAGAEAALRETLQAGAARDGRPAIALGAALELQGRPEEARKIYEEAADGSRAANEAQAELARMDRGEPAAPMIRSAQSGAAEALFTIAGALGAERNGAVALLYARTALALRPELNEARVLVAGLLDAQGQHQAAIEAFQIVPRSSPLFETAELGRADALLSLDREDEAIVALQSLAATYPDSLDVQLALASALRRAERWGESAGAYDDALALIDPVEPRHWPVFYERGIAHERGGQWKQAEADFLKALELQPGQPLVMNYLGYSWVEQRENYDRAQEMIEKAVAQRPEDGYITDSLGWVLYRVGKYEEAVPHLERAVELMPTDPIINDHLGDALWMVGRKREAEFQWRRAMSFDPDEKDAKRIREKLSKGLEAVLREEEGARAEAAARAERVAKDDG